MFADFAQHFRIHTEWKKKTNTNHLTRCQKIKALGQTVYVRGVKKYFGRIKVAQWLH